ncbi:GNAT family N-acetyltransferase [Saccharibacillus kuerlensis]|uniref:GNAT family N-acetyltransferase n=1 Tax=Saccharibacillus kuerlensis TaxID=459527 RepID=A0ABQ2L7T2_9BACL|nr:GNAT family N-acetyltransferase [Saccharibacillus kuerlensis]GGO03975.1 GNAT family N-acetyltransferase [Saccharibacillus kuerlensis]
MLNEQQIQEIETLQRICEQADHISLKLNGDMLKMDTRQEGMDYFHYENENLVGFLGLYGFGGQFEVCGMVHPDCRRQGIFTKLWNEALSSGRLDSTPTILLNAPKASLTAPEWLKKVRCRYAFSEHEMAWHADVAVKKAAADHSHALPLVSHRAYKPLDRNAVLHLCADGFDMSAEDMDDMLNEESRSVNRSRSMILLDDQTVGTFVMDYDIPDQAWIFGLVIDASFRGRGIGRNILNKIISRENDRGRRPYISVETQNENALYLYESCGFRSYAVQDYYELNK